MSYYLISNPNPHRRNFRSQRPRPIDLIVIHATDSAADLRQPDTGTENMRVWLRHADAKVAWHVTTDSDTADFIIPDSHVGFHAGNNGIDANNRSLGIEQQYKPDNWRDDSLPDWYKTAVMLNTATVTALWCQRHDIEPVLRTSRAEATLGGITGHSHIQPHNRTDPGWSDDEWTTFIDYVQFYMSNPLVALGSDDEEAHRVRPDVSEVQMLLNDAGYECGEVDGIAGPVTDGCIRRWQAATGFSVTGVTSATQINTTLYGKDPEAVEEISTRDWVEALEARVTELEDKLSACCN